MKYAIFILIIGITGLAACLHETPKKAFLHAAIYNNLGDEVWALDQPNQVDIIKNQPKIILGKTIPIYESFLDHVSACKLTVWLDFGDGMKHYQDYNLNEQSTSPMFASKHTKVYSKRNSNEVKEAEKGLKNASPIQHLEWRRLQKGGTIEPQKIIETRKIIKERLDAQKQDRFLRDAGLNSWNFLGPGNIGGRVRAIAVKPRAKITEPYEIFIGAAGGGIWRSTDSGNTWNAIDDFLPSLAVTSIVINPNNPNIMYAATGEGQTFTMGLPGAGIFKSTNGGLNWNQLASTANPDFYWVNKLAIHPNLPNLIYAVTTTANKEGSGNNIFGILKVSSDSGTSWNTIGTAISFSGGLTDIDVHPFYPNHVTVSGYKGYFLSTDGGQNFVSQLTNDPINNPTKIPDQNFGTSRIEIAMAKNDTNVVYALVNNLTLNVAQIYRSIDEGVNWNLQSSSANVFAPSGINVGDYANEVWVDPLNENNLYFGGVNLWKSADGGVNITAISDWTEYHNGSTQTSLHADQHLILPAPDYSPLNRTVFFGNDGGIQMTSNLSTVNVNFGWDNLCNTSLGITQFYSGGVAVDGSPFGGGAQDNSFSSGTSTSNWYQPNTGDGAYFIVSHADEDIMYANTNFNRLWRSADGGLTWATPIADYEGNAIFVDLVSIDIPKLISPIVMDPDNANRIYMGAQRLYRYNNNLNVLVSIKDSLTPIALPNTITSIDVRNTGQRLWVGYSDGTIEFSENGGSSWSGDLNNLNMPNRFVTDIAIKPGNINLANEAIVTLAGYIGNNIWLHTKKFGNSSWTDISLPFPIQVNCVTYNPANHNWIYAGTDLGIFASEDKGQTWSVTPIYGATGNEYGNEGPVYTEVTDMFWSGDGGINGPYRLWATTFGRGLWRSNFVLDKIYVDKTAPNDFGPGTLTNPYKTLRAAANSAGHGATIVFLSNGNHDEAPSSVVLDKRILIELGNGPVIVN